MFYRAQGLRGRRTPVRVPRGVQVGPRGLRKGPRKEEANIEMLFDDGFENAFANDFESLDTRLGMFMQGTGLADDPTTQESTRVREFRQKMAESQGGLEQMLEAVGWCIAEQCTGKQECVGRTKCQRTPDNARRALATRALGRAEDHGVPM